MRQEKHNPCWCRRAVSSLAHRHPPKSMRGHPVNILLDHDGVKALSLVDLRGHGMLQQNPVDIRVTVELLNLIQEFLSSRLFRHFHFQGVHPDTSASVALHPHVSS